MTRNHFPPHYAELLSETNLPAELIPQYTTLEYALPNRRAGPPVFLFVVDTCLSEDQLDLEFAATPRYCSPEIRQGGQGSKASDIWSLGMVLYYLYHFSKNKSNKNEIKNQTYIIYANGY